MMAARNPRATEDVRAHAHSLLAMWYTDWVDPKNLSTRYMYAAAHHANRYMQIVGPGRPAPSTVLKQADAFNLFPHMKLVYKDAWSAIILRRTTQAALSARAKQKRVAQPNRYKCANAGCGIGASAGMMLQRCKWR